MTSDTKKSALAGLLKPVWRLGRRILPKGLEARLYKSPLALRLRGFPTKSEAQFDTWQRKYERGGGALRLGREYKKMMLGAGNIRDEHFFDGKIVVDIGCGPGDSLGWIEGAKARIGIDPLADQFMKLGIAEHDMIYLNAGGEDIPLPSDYADVVFSFNALDHVDDLYQAMREMRRILRPGGHLIVSINLDQLPTLTEPHMITYAMLEKHLFKGWVKEYEAIRPEGQSLGDFYKFFYEDAPADYRPKHMILWARYKKP